MKRFRREFKGLKSIGQVISHTTRGNKQTSEVRYYISSREPKVKEFAKSARGHWSIESMHRPFRTFDSQFLTLPGGGEVREERRRSGRTRPDSDG